MKTPVFDYVFNATAKTVTFSKPIPLTKLLMIANKTDGIILYLFNDPTLGGIVVDNVLTLTFDTTTMSNTDELLIYMEEENTDFENLTNLLQLGLSEIVHQLQSIRNDGGMADSAGRVRANIEVGTVSFNTTTNLPSIGGYQASLATMTLSNSGAQNLRSKIAIS